MSPCCPLVISLPNSLFLLLVERTLGRTRRFGRGDGKGTFDRAPDASSRLSKPANTAYSNIGFEEENGKSVEMHAYILLQLQWLSNSLPH